MKKPPRARDLDKQPRKPARELPPPALERVIGGDGHGGGNWGDGSPGNR